MIRPEEFTAYAEMIIPLLGKRKPSETTFAEIMQIFSSNLPCTRCGVVKPLDHFHRSATFKKRGGRMPLCKECLKKEYQK